MLNRDESEPERTKVAVSSRLPDFVKTNAIDTRQDIDSNWWVAQHDEAVWPCQRLFINLNVAKPKSPNCIRNPPRILLGCANKEIYVASRSWHVIEGHSERPDDHELNFVFHKRLDKVQPVLMQGGFR